MKFGSKLLCVLLLLMSIMVSSASTVVAADSFANDVTKSAEAEPDLLMESKFHNTLAQSSDFARVSFTDANVADSFISASFISGFFAMIYGVLLAEGVITSSTVLTASVISANIGVLAGSSVVSSFFIAMIPILTPILYLVLGVVGFAVTLYVIDQVSRASNDIVESLILSLVDFFGNSTSSSINLDKDFTSDVAGSTEFISRSFSTDRVASLDDYTGDISVTASSNGSYYLNTNDWTWNNRVSGIYPMIYDEYYEEYFYANDISLSPAVPTRTLSWFVTNEEGYHYGSRSNEYDADISQVETEMMALNGNAALKAYQNVSEYPILYSTTGDLSDLVDVNNELKGYVRNKKAMVNDVVNATDSDMIEVQDVTPSSIAGYVGDRSVKLSDDLKIVDSITGDVLSDSMTGVKLGVDDSLSGNWLDDTFFIGATELEWDADGTGQIKDKRTGTGVFGDLKLKREDWDKLISAIKLGLSTMPDIDVDSDGFYVYSLVDLIKDELTVSGGNGSIDISKVNDPDYLSAVSNRTPNHTIRKHVIVSDAALKARSESGETDVATTWTFSVVGLSSLLYYVNVLAVKGRKFIDYAQVNNSDELFLIKSKSGPKQLVFESSVMSNMIYLGYGYKLGVKINPTGVSVALASNRNVTQNGSVRNYNLKSSYPIIF